VIITFELVCGTVDDKGPCLEIWVNEVLVKDFVATATEIISIDTSDSYDKFIIVKHKNKTEQDTVLENNKIIADKFVRINHIWIDDILLPDALHYGEVTPIYSIGYLTSLKEVPPETYHERSLYFNGTIRYFFIKNYFNFLDSYFINKDNEFISNNYDSLKYFGSTQEVEIEEQIIDFLTKHGYSITN
jgi:hypothetical protein